MLYSIGDIHGNIKCLKLLYQKIREHIKSHGKPSEIIFLGDYIDRGPDSRAVLDFLMHLSDSDDIKHVFLLGNHEQMLIDSFSDNQLIAPNTFNMWMNNGGVECLHSFNIKPILPIFQREFNQKIVDWFKNKCQEFYIKDRVIFVHAMYNLNKDYENYEFSPYDSACHLWGRQFNVKDDDRYFMVCGHTPKSNKPHFSENYICIDTGCGKLHNYPLTAVILQDGRRVQPKPYNFIQVDQYDYM